jgi:shikimate dehydrogenase
MTAKAGVIGWPIEHSLSPILHGHWLKQYGIDGTFERISAEPGKFEDVIAKLQADGFRGVNVTVPYKETAFNLGQMVRPAARIAGAANLMVFAPDGIGVDNTDATGLFDSLQHALGSIALSGKNIVLLGAGGAARGAAYGLHALGNVAKVTILNRNKERADQLVAHINAHLPNAKFETGTLDDWTLAAEDARLVVNTTSAGMKGNPPLSINLAALPKEAAVCDIVYDPLETPLLKAAKARNLMTIDGLGMLMHQAAPSFQAFFFDEMRGTAPKVTPALRAELEQVLRARG